MSLFGNTTFACPLCETEVVFEYATSVNGGRSPNLRHEIMERTFQQGTCTCGNTFRVSPEFLYIDVPRGQWLTVLPARQLVEWSEGERRSFRTFDITFGTKGARAAKEIGTQLRPRLVFGWEGLREKLLIGDLGYDDTTVELVKLQIMREQPEMMSIDGVIRLVAADEQSLYFALLNLEDEHAQRIIGIAKTVLDQDLSGADWDALRSALSLGYFVDSQRLYRAAA